MRGGLGGDLGGGEGEVLCGRGEVSGGRAGLGLAVPRSPAGGAGRRGGRGCGRGGEGGGRCALAKEGRRVARADWGDESAVRQPSRRPRTAARGPRTSVNVVGEDDVVAPLRRRRDGLVVTVHVPVVVVVKVSSLRGLLALLGGRVGRQSEVDERGELLAEALDALQGSRRRVSGRVGRNDSRGALATHTLLHLGLHADVRGVLGLEDLYKVGRERFIASRLDVDTFLRVVVRKGGLAGEDVEERLRLRGLAFVFELTMAK